VNYLSPLTLLETGAQPPSREDLPALIRRARKRWLAELELSGTGFLPLGGNELSREQIISLLDELNDPKRYELHLRIYSQRAFCRFLETGEASFFYWKTVSELLADKETLRVVEPHFTRRLVREHVQALRDNDAAKMWALREIRIPKKDPVLDVLYDKLLDVLYKRIEEFRSGVELLEQEGRTEPALALMAPELVKTWNGLPSDLEGVRDDLAELYLRLYRAVADLYPDHFLLEQIADTGSRLSCGRTGRVVQARLQRLHHEGEKAGPAEQDYFTKANAKEKDAGLPEWRVLLAKTIFTVLSLVMIFGVLYVLSR